MAFIKSINTAPNSQRWEVTYERDFTTGGLDNDYRDAAENNPYTVAGTVGTADWVAWADVGTLASNQNYTSAGGMGFNSSGIQIAPSIVAAYDSSNYWDTWMNAPRIVAPLDELVPGHDDQDMVCIQLYALASRTFATDYEFMGLCMGLNAQRDNDNMFALASAQYNGALKTFAVRGNTGANETMESMPTYFEIIIYPGINQTRIATGTWDGDFPSPGQGHALSAYQANHDSCAGLTSANTYIGLVASTCYFGGGTATAFTATAKKIRVSKLEAIEHSTNGLSCV